MDKSKTTLNPVINPFQALWNKLSPDQQIGLIMLVLIIGAVIVGIVSRGTYGTS